jgi:hypothetical protein
LQLVRAPFGGTREVAGIEQLLDAVRLEHPIVGEGKKGLPDRARVDGTLFRQPDGDREAVKVLIAKGLLRQRRAPA